VKFRFGSIEEWNGPGPWDLVFANAVLQWIGNHERLLPRLMERIASGGSLAIQIPDNLGEPCQLAMREVAHSPPFAAKLGKASEARTAINSETWYFSLLKPLSSRVDIWRTTYYHPLAGGVDGIVEWLKGSGLIPFLQPLSGNEQAAYLAAYRDELAKTHKPLPDGTVILPFPRLFIVATR
jgi:trans-aconitate 2-methyltransferase